MKPGEKPQGAVRPPYTFDDMMNQPCKLHSGVGRPASHTTRQCIWVERLQKGGTFHHPHHHPQVHHLRMLATSTRARMHHT